jgi:protein ImuA
MAPVNPHIISRLQSEILSLQGLKATAVNRSMHLGLGPINAAFPNGCFPLGAVHEFIADSREEKAACTAFISGLLSPLMKQGGVVFWISNSRTLFAPALKSFDIEPDHVLFADLRKEKEILWLMEEALKCEALVAVVGELRELSFTASRRLQLAVEQSRVTGFLLRQAPRTLNTTACVTRWKIHHLPSETADGLPGIGFPRWKLELLKVRNGKPGTWELSWVNNSFHVQNNPIIQTAGIENPAKTADLSSISFASVTQTKQHKKAG